MSKLSRKQLQQVIILGVLFMAAAGYAVYQLMFTGTTRATTRSSAQTSSVQQEQATEQQQTTTIPDWLSTSGPARDPFVIPSQFDNLASSRVQQNTRPQSRVASLPNASALPPMPITPAAGAPYNTPEPSLREQASSETQQEQLPTIAVTGVVIGERPLALVRVGGGNQRIVMPGHQMEGGYVLRTVSREGIVLEKDGNAITLRPGGNLNAK